MRSGDNHSRAARSEKANRRPQLVARRIRIRVALSEFRRGRDQGRGGYGASFVLLSDARSSLICPGWHETLREKNGYKPQRGRASIRRPRSRMSTFAQLRLVCAPFAKFGLLGGARLSERCFAA